VPTLGNKDNQILEQRGISAYNGAFGSEVAFTSTGIAWLFNYLYSSGNVGSMLTLMLLREVARFRPKKDSWRVLRFKALPIPVYDTNYFQLVFYLEGSPPRAFQAFYPSISSIPTSFDVPHMEGGTFRTRNDQIVKIEFSESEVERLAKGNLLVV
jgi:hypothetical protein